MIGVEICAADGGAGEAHDCIEGCFDFWDVNLFDADGEGLSFPTDGFHLSVFEIGHCMS